MIKVYNLESPRSSRPVANQFVITDTDPVTGGEYFQSYQTVIAFKSNAGKITLDTNAWDYSRTTSKYRNQFLGESKKETEAKIASGEYVLADLNAS